MVRRASLLPSLPWSLVVAVAMASAGCHWSSAAERAAAPIAEKNAEARGGLKAWRAVQAMTMSGRLEAGRPRNPVKLAMAYLRPRNGSRSDAGSAVPRDGVAEAEKPLDLPFVLELARPRKSRLEIRFGGHTAVQVFDGTRGWKVRPFLGRHEVEPFTPEELREASMQTELDGLLIDYAAKDSRVELEGTEPVEGRDAYKLKVTLDDGQVRHVWVDAKTWLDVKVDGSRRMDGKPRPVWTYLRDYRPVDGLMIPHVLETTAEGVKGSEKILVEKVTVNPPLADSRFARPE